MFLKNVKMSSSVLYGAPSTSQWEAHRLPFLRELAKRTPRDCGLHEFAPAQVVAAGDVLARFANRHFRNWPDRSTPLRSRAQDCKNRSRRARCREWRIRLCSNHNRDTHSASARLLQLFAEFLL